MYHGGTKGFSVKPNRAHRGRVHLPWDRWCLVSFLLQTLRITFGVKDHWCHRVHGHTSVRNMQSSLKGWSRLASRTFLMTRTLFGGLFQVSLWLAGSWMCLSKNTVYLKRMNHTTGIWVILHTRKSARKVSKYDFCRQPGSAGHLTGDK